MREATGPSRELDARIWQAVVNGATHFTEGFGYSAQVADDAGFPLAPRLTTSIDATAAFAERVLPEWDKAVYQNTRDGFYVVELEWPSGSPSHAACFPPTGRAMSEPLAILAAIIAALIAKTEHAAAHNDTPAINATIRTAQALGIQPNEPERSSPLDAMVEIGQVEGLP